MTRPISSTIRQYESDGERKPGFGAEELPIGIVEVQDVTAGIVNNLPRDKRPPGSLITGTNARVRKNWVGRRPGWSRYAELPPDVNDIIKVVPFRDQEDVDWIIRLAVGSAHASRTNSGNWNPFTGDLLQFYSKITYAQFPPSRMFVAVGPQQKITEINIENFTMTEVPATEYICGTDPLIFSRAIIPSAKFVTSFAERIVVAYLYREDGVFSGGIQWSKPEDPLEWNQLEPVVVGGVPNPCNLVETGAGEEFLNFSPSDTGDEITGIFSFEQVMIILRERSIWHATRQPFATAPFRFIPVTTEVGCDMPYTAVRVESGLIFADYRTKGVYFYRPGILPQRLNDNIADLDSFLQGITNLETAEAAFDPLNREYHLSYSTTAAPSDNRLGDTDVLNLETGGWVHDLGPLSTFISSIDDVGDQLMIDDVPTMIDVTPGTIDSYAFTEPKKPLIIKNAIAIGEDGRMFKQDEDAPSDPGTVGNQRPLMTLRSQDMGQTGARRSLQTLEFITTAADDGVTGVVLKTVTERATTTEKTVTDISTRTKVGHKKPRTGDEIFWELQSDALQFRIYEWWVRIIQKGIKHLTGIQ